MERTLFAKKLKEYRLDAGITGETLAERAGLSDGYVRQLESGLKSPTLGSLTALAAALHVPPEWLIADDPARITDKISPLIGRDVHGLTAKQVHLLIETLEALLAGIIKAGKDYNFAKGCADGLHPEESCISIETKRDRKWKYCLLGFLWNYSLIRLSVHPVEVSTFRLDGCGPAAYPNFTRACWLPQNR